MNRIHNSSDQCYPGIVVVPVIFTVSGITVMCLNVCVLVALTLSKSITERIRVSLMILCVSDFFYGAQIILITIPDIDTSYKFCYCVRFTLTLFVSLSSTMIFLLSVDRCICLYFETSYMMYVTNKRVRVMYVTVWIIVPILTFVRIGHLDTSNPTFRTLTRSHREIVFVFCEFFVRMLTLLFSVATILKIRAIRNKTPVVTEDFQNTMKLLFLICMYQALFLPSNIHKLIWVTRPDLMDSLGTFRQFSSVIMASTGLINPLLYTLRFTDCRLSLLLIMCRWNKTMSRRIEYKKKQLLAPFLDCPRFVGVSEFKSSQETHGREMTQQNQAVSVMTSPTPTSLFTVRLSGGCTAKSGQS